MFIKGQLSVIKKENCFSSERYVAWNLLCERRCTEHVYCVKKTFWKRILSEQEIYVYFVIKTKPYLTNRVVYVQCYVNKTTRKQFSYYSILELISEWLFKPNPPCFVSASLQPCHVDLTQRAEVCLESWVLFLNISAPKLTEAITLDNNSDCSKLTLKLTVIRKRVATS